MLPSCCPSPVWLSESEPLLFDDEFCENLMKELQREALPTPPLSPPPKPSLWRPLSGVEQLELVSELLEDTDLLQQLNWTCSEFNGEFTGDDPGSDDCLWPYGKNTDEKLLSSSPLLSDISTDIFAEIAGSSLHCHADDELVPGVEPLQESPGLSEASSDYGSLSAGGDSSSSDSEDEIDVVTVRRCSTRSQAQQQQEQLLREQQRALKRCHMEIQQQHNYAAPRPTSPCAKRHRGDSHRLHPRPKNPTPRHSADFEDEEERRRTHNVMERQRRNELKNCFLRLRDNVPELSNNDKASKVVILKRAKESIWNLETQEQSLSQKKDKLQQRQEQLRVRLEQLKRL
ncbi:myelocytomatosis oncogene homolog [Hoplias malabaricus]|uniref:myelocytomatosis oncogene homolog n=1 Tax=Hoplias malabaricus TaxID=27720 RepID=UPI003462E65C